jgi:hypothetical protein
VPTRQTSHHFAFKELRRSQRRRRLLSLIKKAIPYLCREFVGGKLSQAG